MIGNLISHLALYTLRFTVFMTPYSLLFTPYGAIAQTDHQMTNEDVTLYSPLNGILLMKILVVRQ